MKFPRFILTVAILLSALIAIAGTALAQRPPTDRHVAELGRFFDGVKIAAPIVEQRLAIYPVLVDDVPMLHGTWQTLDEAITRGTLVIREKGGGSVPVVSVENRSYEAHILLMMGDVIKGGMQTRTVRYDTVLRPVSGSTWRCSASRPIAGREKRPFPRPERRCRSRSMAISAAGHRKARFGGAWPVTTPHWERKTTPEAWKGP